MDFSAWKKNIQVNYYALITVSLLLFAYTNPFDPWSHASLSGFISILALGLLIFPLSYSCIKLCQRKKHLKNIVICLPLLINAIGVYRSIWRIIGFHLFWRS